MSMNPRALEILHSSIARLRAAERRRRRAACRPRIEGLEERALLSLGAVSVSDPAFYGSSGIGRAQGAAELSQRHARHWSKLPILG